MNKKPKLDLFGYLFVIGTMLICFAMYIRFYNDYANNLADLLAMTGCWLIFFFFSVTYVLGINRGQYKLNISIPKKTAFIVFSFSLILFVTSFYLNSQI